MIMTSLVSTFIITTLSEPSSAFDAGLTAGLTFIMTALMMMNI